VVGIVVVSHSDGLAEGVVTLAREMGGEELALEAAGGMEEPGVLGTDPERVRAAIERAMSGDGVLVLMDLGSALMSAEFAVELLTDASGPVTLSDAPLVEGAVAAAVAARGGAALAEVAAQARGALAMKVSQLDVSTSESDDISPSESPADGPPTEAVAADVEASLPVRNEIGLHARPAARMVEVARRFDAEVRVAKASGGEPVRASSLTNVVALGARFGDTLLVSAVGPQAAEAIAALTALANEGFGDGIAAGAAEPARPEPAAPAGGEPAPAVVEPPAAGDVLTGVPASTGIALGGARQLRSGSQPPPAATAQAPERELARLEQGIATARERILRDRETVAARAGQGEAEIFDAHLALLDDEAMLEPAVQAIDAGTPAEHAWHDAAAQVAARYRGLDSALLRERAADVLDVGRRVVGVLTDERDSIADHAGIVVAGELTPADAAGLDPARVAGIATAHGTATAHAAILARGLGLPAVVGLGDAVLGIPDGTQVLLDGEAGTLLVDPPDDVVREADARRRRAQERRVVARAQAHEPGVTRDGTRVEVFANLGAAGEAARAVELGAEGVGLLRTEFLFLDRPELPTEDEQAETLREIAVALDGRPLIVRTLDAGADKPLPALPMPSEANPFLGVRGIRMVLERPEILQRQFSAILRVAAEHPVKAMLPMVSTAQEIRAAREVLEQARRQTGVTVPLELGIMVEVPAAALTASGLAVEADFFSLGTNDLTQYTMAAERGNERLSSLLTGPQPAVLRLVQETVRAAGPRGRFVGVCGELAGDPASAVLLVGLGVTELSMAPGLVPEVKAALREVDLSTARTTAQAALQAEDGAAARALALALL
jgi:multiphosphoryl transfer protein